MHAGAGTARNDFAGEPRISQLMESFTGLAGVITEIIGHMTHEWPLVVVGHINYGNSRTSIREPNPLAGRDLGAAVQPQGGREGQRGREGQADTVPEL